MLFGQAPLRECEIEPRPFPKCELETRSASYFFKSACYLEWKSAEESSGQSGYIWMHIL